MTTESFTPEREEKIRQKLSTVPFAQLLGLEMGSLSRGMVELILPLHDGLKQDSGMIHGGAIASLIDSATAFAIITLVPEGERITTIDLSISYLRPLTTGQAVATAKVVRLGKRVIAVSAEVYGPDGTLAATALSSYLRLGGAPAR